MPGKLSQSSVSVNSDSADKLHVAKNEQSKTPPKRQGTSIKIVYKAF